MNETSQRKRPADVLSIGQIASIGDQLQNVSNII